LGAHKGGKGARRSSACTLHPPLALNRNMEERMCRSGRKKRFLKETRVEREGGGRSQKGSKRRRKSEKEGNTGVEL